MFNRSCPYGGIKARTPRHHWICSDCFVCHREEHRKCPVPVLCVWSDYKSNLLSTKERKRKKDFIIVSEDAGEQWYALHCKLLYDTMAPERESTQLIITVARANFEI